MADTSNAVQILVACAMLGIRLIHTNYLRLDRTIEMGSNINVRAIYGIQFAPMNYLLLAKATKMVSQIKVCMMYGIQFAPMNRLCHGISSTYANGWLIM